jgi:hypothetical protein
MKSKWISAALGVAVLGLSATSPAAAATKALIAYGARAGNAVLASVDAQTGIGPGPGAPLSAGAFISFSDFAGLAIAPGGTPWGIYQSGGGDAYLAAFDPLTGGRTGPGAYLDVGGHLSFGEVGAISFAPDGTAWVTYQSGGGDAYLAAFDPLTGFRTGPGAYLDVSGHLSFSEVGAMSFAPDGTAWVTYQAGGGDIYLAAFDPLTGFRTGPGAYLDVSGHLSFGDVGGMSFAPDGAAWIAYQSGGGDAYLAEFDPSTGFRKGPGGYINLGSNLAFSNFGAVAIESLPSVGGGVPEPATWAMMLLGFGIIGTTLRRRSALTA